MTPVNRPRPPLAVLMRVSRLFKPILSGHHDILKSYGPNCPRCRVTTDYINVKQTFTAALTLKEVTVRLTAEKGLHFNIVTFPYLSLC